MSAPGTGKAPACNPTWRGHVETTKDALLIFQACFNGALQHCFRRPHDRERSLLIKSGNVFVYEEGTSGIKRWTDGIPWSPSRILTNFLIYRQLNSPFPPGEKKRATKRSQRPLKPGEPYPNSNSNNGTPTTDRHESSFRNSRSPSPTPKKEDDSPEKDTNRGLVGSLVDSYEFKDNGLLKKTMTVTINGVQHHLVSYYSLEDAKYRLKTPREDERLKDLTLDDALIHQPKFKFPNLDDAGDGAFEQMDGTANAYAAYYHNGYNPYAPQQMGYPMHPAQPYPYHGAYAPAHPPPHGSYAHGPHPAGSYQPIPPSAHYPPHHPHGGYYAQHPPAHYQNPTPQQSPGYPAPGYSMPQHQQPPVHTRHPSHVTSESVPRTNSSYEHPSHPATASSEVYSAGNNTGPPPADHANSSAQPPQHAQTWPGGGYSQPPAQQQPPPPPPAAQPANQAQGWQARPDASVYTDYRSQA